VCGKSRLPGSDPRTAQSVANRCNGYATQAPFRLGILNINVSMVALVNKVASVPVITTVVLDVVGITVDFPGFLLDCCHHCPCFAVIVTPCRKCLTLNVSYFGVVRLCLCTTMVYHPDDRRTNMKR
jgi:hypothetical protein